MTAKMILTKTYRLIHNYTFQKIVFAVGLATLIVAALMTYLGWTGPIF